MRKSAMLFAFVFVMIPGLVLAQDYTRSFSGNCSGQNTGVTATIQFTPTGGNFLSGTGTGTVVFVIENTSGLYPSLGNPVLTRFYFNVPTTASVSFWQASVLAGATIRSTGTDVLGVPVPAGCSQLGADQDRTSWYTLEGDPGVGQFGVFTAGGETADGIKAGLVDASTIVGCVPQGPIFSPLVVAGPVAFTFNLTGLDTSLDSSADFQFQCSLVEGSHQASAFGAKFQGLGNGGGGSCFTGDPCSTVATKMASWGSVKALYRN